MEDRLKYFFEIYEGLPRAGPGDNRSTRKAYHFLSDLPPHPMILDVGCGPGMQSIELAKLSKGSLIALDIHRPFLDKLEARAKQEGVFDQIKTIQHSMFDMQFKNETFDIIWSEGALYFMGFENGLAKCAPFLKPGGYIAASEAVWLKPNPPKILADYFEKEYPQMKNIENNLILIENLGFKIINYFVLPRSDWTDNYYAPLQEEINRLKKKYADNKLALEVMLESENEIRLYKKYSGFFGYAFFIMQKQSG